MDGDDSALPIDAGESRMRRYRRQTWEWLRARSYRDVVLIVGIILNLVAGTQYNYSVYSPTLRKQEGYSSTETTLIATMGNLGLYCGFLIGWIYDKTGPKWTALGSGLMVFFGYFMTWLALSGVLPNYAWLLAIFYVFVGQGCWGLYEVALLTNMKNFKGPHLGIITGILAAAFGLSSGLFTLIWSGFFSPDDDVKGFILLMAIIVTSIAGLSMFTIRVITPKAVATVDADESGQNDERKKIIDDEDDIKSPEAQTVAQQELDITGKQLALETDFWLLWFSFLIGAGTGLMMINHLGDLVLSLDGSTTDKNILVGLLSISNCVGRIGIGYLSDRLKHRVNKAYWLIVCFLLLSLSHFVFFFVTSFYYLPVLVAVTALSYGGLMAIVPMLIPAYWGFPHMGINYGFMALAPACGSIAFGQIASFLYDHYKEDGEDSCYGDSCYEVAFSLTASTCLIAAALSFVLARRRVALERRLENSTDKS
eukprot:TRINITY_DN3295_c2_g3_i2.p1 TRINITY_DN3295_c2_g3~~TRINITY_DN3295_c2_g3_i2.p1  ORF type:complete len:481 (+),score=67.53 TRINITY_DN3295_c2_g3_i2:102-1544(+)